MNDTFNNLLQRKERPAFTFKICSQGFDTIMNVTLGISNEVNYESQ